MDGIDVSWGSHIPQRCASLPPYWRWLLPYVYTILHRAAVQTGNEIIIDGAKFRGYVGRWHRVYIGNKILITPSSSHHSAKACNCFFELNPSNMMIPAKSTFTQTNL